MSKDSSEMDRCKWTLAMSDPISDMWEAGCGPGHEMTTNITPTKYGMRYCPYCGKVIDHE